MPCKGRTSGCRKLKSNKFSTIDSLTNMQALSRTAILKLIEHSEKNSHYSNEWITMQLVPLAGWRFIFCLLRACQVDQGMVMPCAYKSRPAKRNGSWCSKLWVQPLPTFQSLLAPWNCDGNMLIKLIRLFIELGTVDYGLALQLLVIELRNASPMWTWLKPLRSHHCPRWQPACFAQCSSPPQHPLATCSSEPGAIRRA